MNYVEGNGNFKLCISSNRSDHLEVVSDKTIESSGSHPISSHQNNQSNFKSDQEKYPLLFKQIPPIIFSYKLHICEYKIHDK